MLLISELYTMIFYLLCLWRASLVAQMIKSLPARQETWAWYLGPENPLGKEIATHSSHKLYISLRFFINNLFLTVKCFVSCFPLLSPHLELDILFNFIQSTVLDKPFNLKKRKKKSIFYSWNFIFVLIFIYLFYCCLNISSLFLWVVLSQLLYILHSF